MRSKDVKVQVLIKNCKVQREEDRLTTFLEPVYEEAIKTEDQVPSKPQNQTATLLVKIEVTYPL